MPSKQVTIIPFNKSMSVLSKVDNNHSLCYYLNDDYSYYTNLKEKFEHVIDIRNLSGIFDQTFQELKESIVELIFGLNKKYNSYEWWGGQIASKSTSAISLVLNITYLICAKRILSKVDKDVIFIVNSPALSSCLSKIAKEQGYRVDAGKFHKWADSLKNFVHHFMQIGSFFVKITRNYILSLKVPKPVLKKKAPAQKRVVIRSWITEGTLKDSKGFQDRNFGHLPGWLRSKGCDVWILPMFFNISMTKEIYAYLKNHDQPFLIPEHYLKFSDYVRSIYNGYKVFHRHVKEIKIRETDVSPLFNEALRKQGFDVSLCILNLSGFVLRRLRQQGFEVDKFYYAYENNASEKQFVLSCRKHYPDTNITGFQHTAIYPNQLTVHMAPDEKDYHPLPDRIVCSSQIYRNLHERARFPKDILEDGPNLRISSVHTCKNNNQKTCRVGQNKKILLLPLTFSYNLAFELVDKVKEAVKGLEGYTVCIRSHPVLSKKILKNYLHKINMQDTIFADEGGIQEWFAKSHAVISTGGTITILEAVCFEIPVIRVIPDNTFFYDPLAASDYLLEPVNTVSQIKQQLGTIDCMYEKGNGVFTKISQQVLHDYFREPNEENLKVFL